jgi:molybdopterin molybdotransferase
MALISVEEALTRVLAGLDPLPEEDVATANAHRRVLAGSLTSKRTQPPADVSSMDGYAVRSADLRELPVRLNVVGEAAAGSIAATAVTAGQAVRILTGGLLPPGADTIVIQENAERSGSSVLVRQAAPPGRYIRPKGLDFNEGDQLLPEGRMLSVRDLALAAAMNYPAVPVHRRPRVAIFSTGDELRPAGSALAPAQIVSSNGLALAAMAEAEGAEGRDFGIVPDRVEAIVQTTRDARDWGADVLVTAGGASVGDYDLVQQALAGEGLQLDFWKVAIRPGKPLMFGTLGGSRVLGLPGNPVSAFVCAFLFLIPLIRRLSGREDIRHATEQALLGCALPANDERQDYLRSSLDLSGAGLPLATPLSGQDSSRIATLAQAECLVVRGPFAPAAQAGETCTILRLPI